jgi:hypothetical protein
MKTKKPAGENLTIGLDLGDRRHHACVLDEAGEIHAEEVIVNTREVLTVFFARYPGATVVMETGTHRSTRCPQAGTRSSHPTLRSGPSLRPDHLRAAALRGSPGAQRAHK